MKVEDMKKNYQFHCGDCGAYFEEPNSDQSCPNCGGYDWAENYNLE